jgi:hypothetical protein
VRELRLAKHAGGRSHELVIAVSELREQAPRRASPVAPAPASGILIAGAKAQIGS